MGLLLQLFFAALSVMCLCAAAMLVSPRDSVFDGLRIMAVGLLKLLVGVMRNPDFWDSMKALCGGLMWSGPSVWATITLLDPQTMPAASTLKYLVAGAVVGFIGNWFCAWVIRKLNTPGPRP